MTKFSDGPFNELPLRKDGKNKPILGYGTCHCLEPITVRVNTSGKPYYFCPNSTCGANPSPRAQKGWAQIVARIHTFAPRCKKRAQIMAGIRKAPKPKEAAQPEITAPDSDPQPEGQPPATATEPIKSKARPNYKFLGIKLGK